MIILDCELGGTVYVPFAVNDTGGSAADGSSPVADVRLCGAAVDAAPVYSPTVTGPLSHANYGDGLYEVPVACTEGNGFAAGNWYTVYAGATVDTETPQAALAVIRVVAVGDSLHSGAARVMDAVPNAAAGGTGGLAIVGSEMDLVDAPNETAVTAIQAGLSTYAGADTAGTSTLLTRLSAARAGYLDNLSAGAAALEATLTAIKGAGWSAETLAAIKAQLATVAADVAGLDGESMLTATAVDTELSSTHGSGTWGGASGSGANTVTVTVQTSGGTVYEGVRVAVNNATETASPLVAYTNTSGQATFYLDAGTWRAIAAASTAQAGGATNFTVDGAEAVTVTVTAASVPAATSADNYLLYGYERKLEGDGAFGAAALTVTVVRVDASGQTDATANACRRIYGTSYTTDAAGLWSMEIAKDLADSRLTLKFAWTDADSIARTEQWSAVVAASAANASDQIAWADLSPTKTR